MNLKRMDVLKRIHKYTKKSSREVVAIILASILSIPLSFISPYIFSFLIDKVMAAEQLQLFPIVAAGLLIVYGIRLLLDSIHLFCSNRILNRFQFNIQRDIWKKYLKLSFSDYEKKEIGDLKMRLVDDVDGLGNFVKDQVVDYVFNILMVAASLGITLFINYKLTLLCLMVMPLVFFVNRAIGKGNKKVNEQFREVNEEYFSFLHDTLQFWKEIKAHCAEKDFVNRFKAFRKILAKLGYRQIRYWGFSEIFTDFKVNYSTFPPIKTGMNLEKTI